MKQRWRHLIASALALALCLSAAACGKSDDTAGDDWRASGAVVDSGTITHDGESVDVLVTVSESSAAFYRDLPEQILFDSVSFPMSIPDAEQAFNAISFEDMDDDGESDVLVSFIHENGDATELIWIWDPVERYVFREDLSTVIVSGSDLSEYVGLWEYQGKNLWLHINDDATWEFVNDQDEVIEYGTLWVDEYGITLHFDGSGDTLQLDRTVSGDLIDSVNGGTLLPVEGIQSQEPYFTRNSLEINAAVEMGTFLLEDGACSYSGLGQDSATATIPTTAIGRSRRPATTPTTASASCTLTPSATSRRTPSPTLTSSIRLSPAVSSMTSTLGCGSPPQRPMATASAGTTIISTPSAGRGTAT